MSTEKNHLKAEDIEFHKLTAHSYDETIAKEYGMYGHYWLHPFLDSVRVPDKQMRVLDAGCGTGVNTLALAERGFKVTAIDHSHEMIEIARRKAQVSGLLSRIQFELGDVEKLRCEDNEFDGITCTGLLHHSANMRPALSELCRVLKPQGFMYIVEPCDSWTIIGKAVAKSFAITTVVNGCLWRSRNKNLEHVKAPAERPISAKHLFGILDGLGLVYEVEYMTHFPFLSRFLPDFLRMVIVKIISFPWRRTKGDIIFVHAKKP